MTVQCAQCGSFLCRGGNREAAPEGCPMREDFPEFDDLYATGREKRFLHRASLVEAEGYLKWTRIREVAEFAQRIGATRIGIPHCPDMADTARRVVQILRAFNLEALFPPSPGGCDPRGQAQFLARGGADLNVVAGMCVGHEAVFIRTSQAPVVVLVARDARLKHNPAAALYTSRSYLKTELHGHWPSDERPPFRGAGPEILDEMASQMLGTNDPPRSRLAEAMTLAHNLGVTHVGVSFCVGFKEEAAVLSRILDTNGFRVSSVCCKTGAVPKEKGGIQDFQKVRPGRNEVTCNPAAQAELLNRDGVQFAMVLGQCVGHDATTLKRLDCPAICLVAKDRVLAHNTIAGLY